MRKFINKPVTIESKGLFGVKNTMNGKLWQVWALGAVQIAIGIASTVLSEWATQKRIEEAIELSESDVKRYLRENRDLFNEIEILQEENAWLTASNFAMAEEASDEYNPSLNS